MNTELFQSDPRSYALELVENGTSADHLLMCALKYMSHDDCRDMLDCNELSPRFDEDEEEEPEEFDLENEDDVREAFWADNPGYADERDDDKSQNDYRPDIRMAFVDWVDAAHKNGQMSDDLVAEVTLA